MSIRLTCPNGHALKVNESLAGKSGLCPACKARVQIPQLQANDLSEDAIMGILDSLSPGAHRHVSDGEASAPAKSPLPSDHEATGAPKKSCYKCHQEISAEMHICPFCHTYIAKPTDF